MISCTEFIPAYSELFKYIHNRDGYEEVQKFWRFLFKPDGKGIPLVNFVKKDGLKGAVEYWKGTLSEEAADTTRWFNIEEGWCYAEMHYCPSKGRLLQLKDELGIEPYPHYCDHCDYYRPALEMHGLCWIRNHINVDKASCTSIIYDPKVFKGMIQIDENTDFFQVKSAEKEYFHPDFHSSLNMGMEYLGANYGVDSLNEYLVQYTLAVYRKRIDAIKAEGLSALADMIRDTYQKEHAEDALSMELTDNSLSVKIAYCPAVRHLRKTGREVNQWFELSTKTVMETIAKECGYRFTMGEYDAETGATSYCFAK
jgi:hypothetical protein